MNQCDIEKYYMLESGHSASLYSESSDSNKSSLLLYTSSYPSTSLSSSRSLLLGLVQVGASGEQVACGGQGDWDHPPAPSQVRVARCEASGTGGTLDTPSSWRGGSVGVGYLHLEGNG